MNNGLRIIIGITGLFVFLYGWIGQQRALARHRAPDSVGPWLDWRPRIAKREWFASEYGYRLYRWAGWSTLLGGLIMLAAGWL
jgi:hypothetical protein